jgi:DNA-binding transcriptional regulator YdaS (Cro superfamily)
MRYISMHRLWNAVAAECGITPAAVRMWHKVPALRVLAVERAIGRPRHLIRPDIYPKEARRGPKSKRTDQHP